MIAHYLKIAFRNLVKYRTQSVISILGLAVGFVCFALATLWIHYEMTYDDSYDGADRMYILYRKDVLHNSGYSIFSSYPMSTLLKETFPEVEDVCAFNRWKEGDIKVEGGASVKVPVVIADSCFMNMFQVSLFAGNMDFMYTDEKVALTKDLSMQLFGSTDVLGQKVIIQDNERTVCAVLGGLEHSNLSFGYWSDGGYFRQWFDDWSNGSYYTVIKLHKGVDPDVFQQKMLEFSEKASDENIKSIQYYKLMPLTQYHYAHFNDEKAIQFNYLIFFSLIGALVILCSLFNFLSLFITRLRMRMREIGLRKVCGSSTKDLFALFSIEYLLVIFISGFIGMMITELLLPVFRRLSNVSGNIYGEVFLYFIGIVVFSMILLCPFIVKSNIETPNKGRKNSFHKVGLVCQLIIGILFIFCTSIIMKQLYFLNNADLGWERKNIATFKHIYPTDNLNDIGDRITQMSCTEEVLNGHVGLFPKGYAMSALFKDWDGKQDSVPDLMMECIKEGKEVADFYGLKLLKGEMPKTDDRYKMAINESAAKALGMKDPVGKKLVGNYDEPFTIIGLIKDFHTTSPTMPTLPVAFIGEHGISGNGSGAGTITIRYHEGKWKELKENVDALLAKEYPQIKYQLVNVEDVYAEFLQSENTLLKLLGFVAVVCLLIAIFGIFSLVALTCKKRQKEIAIRKINGATVKDILMIFIKEYFIMLTLSAIIAFSVGYALMKHWLEIYVEQTEISLWVFVSIYSGIAGIIAITIGWQVWKAANENPAEVIKSE